LFQHIVIVSFFTFLRTCFQLRRKSENLIYLLNVLVGSSISLPIFFKYSRLAVISERLAAAAREEVLFLSLVWYRIFLDCNRRPLCWTFLEKRLTNASNDSPFFLFTSATNFTSLSV